MIAATTIFMHKTKCLLSSFSTPDSADIYLLNPILLFHHNQRRTQKDKYFVYPCLRFIAKTNFVLITGTFIIILLKFRAFAKLYNLLYLRYDNILPIEAY